MHDCIFLFKLTSSLELKWKFIQNFSLFEHESPFGMPDELKVCFTLRFLIKSNKKIKTRLLNYIECSVCIFTVNNYSLIITKTTKKYF